MIEWEMIKEEEEKVTTTKGRDENDTQQHLHTFLYVLQILLIKVLKKACQ
jgi:hypothetical protein